MRKGKASKPNLSEYTCPVCGYAMNYPPKDHHICPVCLTEFGYDDCGTSYEELRERWKTLSMPDFKKGSK